MARVNNSTWYKGMPKVPGSGRKKGVKNKHTTAVQKARAVATLKMAERTPEVVDTVAEMMLDPKQNVWVRVKLFETWMRYSLPIPQVTVETDKVSMDSAGNLAVTVIKSAGEEEERAEVIDAPPALEAKIVSAEDDQNAN